MATAAATAVAEATVRAAPNFKRGGKKIFLPEHVITFIRPKEHQPPTQATFVVPLQFNKLDLRDYLWHAYNVGVRSVRSFVNQQPIARKQVYFGKKYRPRAQKMMIAELEKPFVWPERLTDPKDLQDFDHAQWKKMQDDDNKRQEERKSRSLLGQLPLPSETKLDGRRELTETAKALLSGKDVWKNNAQLDEKWKEIEQEIVLEK